MKKIKYFLLASTLIFVFSLEKTALYAHTTINTAPTTSCGSLDSLDLATHMSNQVDNRIAGKSPSAAYSTFSNRGTTIAGGPSYIRNTGVWTNAISPIDWTGISPYNSLSGPYNTGTLISPRHVIFAKHYYAPIGSNMVFVDNNNNIYERTLTNVMPVPGAQDIEIGILDSDVPDSITYYPIMASSTLYALLNQYNQQNINTPIVVFDAEKKAIIHSLDSLGSDQYPLIQHSNYTTGARSAFSEILIGGDSSNPMFMLIDNQPVYLGAHYTASWADNPGAYISQINSVMTALGGSYQVTQYTPNCFTVYTANNVPTFTNYSYNHIYINQSGFSSSTVLRTFTASDTDAGETLSFSLVGLTSNATSTAMNVSSYFAIGTSTGQLRQIGAINHELYGNAFNLLVNVKDNHSPNIGSTTITVAVSTYNQPGAFNIILDNRFVSANENADAYPSEILEAPTGELYMNRTSNAFWGLDGITGSITRLKTDGSYDFTYDANQGTSTNNNASLVTSLDLKTDGKVVFSGNFTSVAGIASNRIAQLNTDGTTDVTFSQSIGTGFNGATAFAKIMDDKIITSGVFSSFNGTTTNRLALLNSDGTLNSAFNANVGTGPNTYFTKYLRYSTSSMMFVGGTFSGGLTSYNGTSIGRILRLNTDGAIDSSFTSPTIATSTTFTGLAKLSTGKILVSGNFTVVNGVSRPYIVMLNSDGTVDSSFSTNIGTGPNAIVRSIAVDSQDNIYLAGDFTSFNSNLYSHLVALNPNGTQNAFINSNFGIGFDTFGSPDISSLKILNDGRLAVGGYIYHYNNEASLLFTILETAQPPSVGDLTLATSSDSGVFNRDFVTKNTSVVFTGTGTSTASTTVYLYDSNNFLATTTAGLNGSWTSPSITLSAGSHAINAIQVRKLLDNSSSTVSNTINVTIDPVGPVVSGTITAVGNSLYIPFSETLASSSQTATSSWSVKINGSNVNVATTSIIDNSVYLNLSTSIPVNSSVTVAYIGTDLQDIPGNTVSAFSEISARNDTVTTLPNNASASAVGTQTGGGSAGGDVNIIYNNRTVVTASTSATTSSLPAIKIFTKNLSLGTNNPSVINLQKLLNSLGFTVSTTGAGSSGKETSYFGAKTQSALARFQKSVGIKPSVGFLGPITRKYLLNLK